MMVESTINVVFHSGFDLFKRGRYSRTPNRLAITNGLPFNPTYNYQYSGKNLARFSLVGTVGTVSSETTSTDSVLMR